MAKQNQPHRQLTRRQTARREREHRAQRIMTWLAIGVGIAITAILVFGITTEIAKARRPAARVGDVNITARAFKTRQAYERWMAQLEIYQYQNYLSQLSSQQLDAGSTLTDTAAADDGTSALIQQLQIQVSNLENQLSADLSSVFGGQVLDAMIEEELLRQEAVARGLTVSDDEIQLRTEQILGYDREAASSAVTQTETITDTAVAPPAQQSYDDLYKQFKTNVLDVARFSEDDFRAMVEAQLFRDSIQAALAKDINQVQDQVEITLFSVPTEEEAEALRARLGDEGVDPATVVEEFGADGNDQTTGYTVPWLPVGYLGSQLGTEVEQAAFNTPVGSASAPVLGADGQYYISYVTGHEERELSPDLLSTTEQQAYDGWLTQAKTDRAEYLDWEAAIVTE